MEHLSPVFPCFLPLPFVFLLLPLSFKVNRRSTNWKRSRPAKPSSPCWRCFSTGVQMCVKSSWPGWITFEGNFKIRRIFKDTRFVLFYSTFIEFNCSVSHSIHQVVGSSILIIYDSKHVGAWVIDFAKTLPVPDGVKLTHRKPWQMGNHEEGWLTGIDHLIQVR